MIEEQLPGAAWELTPGQQQVRAIATQFVRPFLNSTLPPEGDPIYNNLAAALAADLIVQGDSITSANVGEDLFNRRFLGWIDIISRKIDPPADARQMRFDRVHIRGSVDDRTQRYVGPSMEPAYRGGTRSESTMWAVMVSMMNILGTAPRLSVDDEDLMESTYYIRSGILKGGAGNHRLLGYVLTGDSSVPGVQWREEQEPPDLVVNDGFEREESFFPPRNTPYLGKSILQPLAESERQVRADVADLRWFMAEATEEEQALLKRFLVSKHRERSLSACCPVATSRANALVRCLRDMRNIRGRRKLDQTIVAVQRRLGAGPPLSPFEEWYEHDRTK